MQNKLSKLFYAIAIILVILFVVLVAIAFYEYNQLLSNPLVLIAPFSGVTKRLCLWFLVPGVVCAIVGYILQRASRK